MWGGLLSPRQQTRLPLILPIDQPPRLSALVRCVEMIGAGLPRDGGIGYGPSFTHQLVIRHVAMAVRCRLGLGVADVGYESVVDLRMYTIVNQSTLASAALRSLALWLFSPT